MSTSSIAASALAASALLAASSTALAAPAASVPADSPVPAASATQQAQADLTAVAHVQGSFSFSQDEATPNQTIKQVFQKTSAALCNVTAAQRSFVDAFLISVGGDVPAPFEATVSQLVEEQGATVQLMGCSCTSNTAGGWAIANARVSGVSIEAVAAQAGL